MTHSKKILALGYLVFCAVMMFGLVGSVKAAFTAPLGAECGEGKESCKSGSCQEVTKGDQKYIGKRFCVCADGFDQANAQCGEKYGAENGVTWECANDNDPFGLKYCKSSTGKEEHIDPSTAGLIQSQAWTGVQKMLTDDEIRKMTTKPQLKINIPGLKFTDPTGFDDGDTKYLMFPLLGEYIRAVYRYGIAVAAILAVVMIIKAGFMWTASGGSSEIISKQKETIEKAVIGLIIAVSSYTILFAINPNLTDFPHMKVQYVKGETWGYASPAGEEPSPFGPGTASEGNNGVPYFAQWSGPWALRSPFDICNENGQPCGPENSKYKGLDKVCKNPKPCTPEWSHQWNGPKPGNAPQFCSTIWQRGCGATSFAMIMAYYGFNTDPFDVAKWSLACEGVFPIDKTVGDKKRMQEKWPGISASWMSIRREKRETIRSKIIESLKNNNPILFNCKNCVGQNRAGGKAQGYDGHFVVITGFHDEKDKTLTDEENMEDIYLNINDPGRNKPAGFAIETMTLKQVLDTFLVAGFFRKE